MCTSALELLFKFGGSLSIDLRIIWKSARVLRSLVVYISTRFENNVAFLQGLELQRCIFGSRVFGRNSLESSVFVTFRPVWKNILAAGNRIQKMHKYVVIFVASGNPRIWNPVMQGIELRRLEKKARISTNPRKTAMGASESAEKATGIRGNLSGIGPPCGMRELGRLSWSKSSLFRAWGGPTLEPGEAPLRRLGDTSESARKRRLFGPLPGGKLNFRRHPVTFPL